MDKSLYNALYYYALSQIAVNQSITATDLSNKLVTYALDNFSNQQETEVIELIIIILSDLIDDSYFETPFNIYLTHNDNKEIVINFGWDYDNYVNTLWEGVI